MIFQLAGTLYDLLKVFCQTGLGKYQALSSWYILSVGFRLVGLGLVCLFFFLHISSELLLFFSERSISLLVSFYGQFFSCCFHGQ